MANYARTLQASEGWFLIRKPQKVRRRYHYWTSTGDFWLGFVINCFFSPQIHSRANSWPCRSVCRYTGYGCKGDLRLVYPPQSCVTKSALFAELHASFNLRLGRAPVRRYFSLQKCYGLPSPGTASSTPEVSKTVEEMGRNIFFV